MEKNKQRNKHNKVTKRNKINKHTKRGIESSENVYHDEILNKDIALEERYFDLSPTPNRRLKYNTEN